MANREIQATGKWLIQQHCPFPRPLPKGGETNTYAHRGEAGRGERRRKPPLPEELKQFARDLRNQLTDAEQLLWQILRQKRMAGYKFRRQHPVPPYVLDYYCHELRLGIELDGGQHLNNARDAGRDAWLAGKGIRVLRYWNHNVLHRTESVLDDIWRVVNDIGAAVPRPAPSRREGDRTPPPPVNAVELTTCQSLGFLDLPFIDWFFADARL